MRQHNAYGLPVDYFEKEKIGTFRFPAAWLGDLSVKEYIEAVMHLLNLGIADSLLDLTSSLAGTMQGNNRVSHVQH